MSALTLVHTADVHLDAPHHALGAAGAKLRQATRRAFVRAIDEAIAREARLFVVAGDLFDTARPQRQTVSFAFEQLTRLTTTSPPIRVILLPGTHDCWGEGGFWDSPSVTALPELVEVVRGPTPVTMRLPDQDVAIHASAHICGRGDQRPLSEMRADPGAAVNIGVAHGSVARGDIEDGSMFGREEIAATGLDYLALGHWHSWVDLSEGGVTAINPGSPEVGGFSDRGRGCVALVTVRDGRAQVERVEVGTLTATQLTINAGDLSGTEDLVSLLADRGDPELLLEVCLEGLVPADVVIDTEHVRERVADAFFALRIRDESRLAAESLEDLEAVKSLTLGRFVELARQRIEQAPDERARRVAERALQVGVAALRNRGESR